VILDIGAGLASVGGTPLMTLNRKWGAFALGLLLLATTWLFSPSIKLKAEATPEDQTLLSAASTLHPVEVFSVSRPASTIQEAFAQAGRDYYPEDRVSYFPDPSLGLGTVITVQRAFPVSLSDGKKTKIVRGWADTVGGLLEEKRILLGAEDRISPALGTPLNQGLTVVITRVARTTVSEFETVAFKTVEQEDGSMWRGERKTVQEGRNGKLRKDYLVIREDGELVSKTLTASEMVEALVNKIVRIGTKLKIGRTFSGDATWYPFPNRWGTKVALDVVRRGVEVRVTNLSNGRSIIVRNEGCICGNGSALIDLAPEYFRALGGQTSQGRLTNIRVEEILN